MKSASFPVLLLFLGGLLGCAEPTPARDGGRSLGTDSGSPADGGSSSSDAGASTSDGGPPPEGIPTLVAIGKFGRITTSCDGGRTWAFNRSDDDAATCEGIDCDHHYGSSTGLTWGDGWFYASFGWGDPPMRIMRSRDGVTWETALETGDLHFAGLAWASDRLVGATTQPHRSTDRGATFEGAEWPEWDVPDGEWPVARQIGWAPVNGGTIAVVSGPGNAAWGAVIVSRDGGLTFTAASSVDAACRGFSRPPVFGGSAWVLPWAREGVLCTSTDGGDTWTAHQVAAGEPLSSVVYTGSEHVAYAGTRRFASPDGTRWMESASDVDVGVLGYDPSAEAFVAVERNTQYGDQRFHRSSDGVSWEALADGAFTASHPITHIVFGWGASDGACAP